MSGVKGMKGGGGKRAGAGRKPKPPARSGAESMLELLAQIARGEVDANAAQVTAAVAYVRFAQTGSSDAGKKGRKAVAAKEAAVGRFSPVAAPRLVVDNS